MRRYRADRLLQEEFQALRVRVLRAVRGRLRARGIHLDLSDLDGAYALAWQGLHAAVLEGQEIDSPLGWLVLVTFRRALDEARTHRLPGRSAAAQAVEDLEASSGAPAAGRERDLAGELDDRIALDQLFEGLSARLTLRERQAATLCYLQGLSRAEAAAQMGISKGRMRKLMEGRGAGDPGVCQKLGALARTIESGAWCESQGSLMRALAYGILKPGGERHRLALRHHSRCPACRAYVLSLRGLAGVLPPALMPRGPLAALLGHTHQRLHLASAARHAAERSPSGRGAGGAGYAAGASGAAGATSAAGGGWLFAGGPLGAKLAVGCLIALGVGGGCLALDGGAHREGQAVHRPLSHHDRSARAYSSAASAYSSSPEAGPVSAPLTRDRYTVSTQPGAVKASREFGPEQSPAKGSLSSGASASAMLARVVPSSSARLSSTGRAASQPSAGRAVVATAPQVPSPQEDRAAEREFSPG